MITDIAFYPRFFDGVRRRTERDVAALPEAAAALASAERRQRRRMEHR